MVNNFAAAAFAMLFEMSRPQTWTEVLALIGGGEESPKLDFKRELPRQGHDFAKDIAAMSKDGGTIVYGIEEDKATRVAANITPVPIDGVEERIRQSTRDVEPHMAFDIEVLRPSPGDTRGVVVVNVPPSPDWPHMVNGRFPVRDGTTTRYLTHTEVAAALGARQQQEHQAGPPARTMDLFDPLVAHLPDITDIRTRSTFDGHAFLRVAVKPADGQFEHQAGAWLGPSLEQARSRAEDAVVTSIDSRWAPRFLTLTDEWRARGTEHWIAGYAGGDEGALAHHHRGSAVIAYRTGHLLMEFTRPTGVFDHADRFGYHCAFEPYVAAELWTMLRFAAEVFSDVRRVETLHAGLHLAGFGGCVSHHATHAEEIMIGNTSHLPSAPAYLLNAVATTARELTSADSQVARRLLDPWLPAFYEDRTPLYDKVLVQRS
jgi:hypothetical protein